MRGTNLFKYKTEDQTTTAATTSATATAAS